MSFDGDIFSDDDEEIINNMERDFFDKRVEERRDHFSSQGERQLMQAPK